MKSTVSVFKSPEENKERLEKNTQENVRFRKTFNKLRGDEDVLCSENLCI